LPLLRRGKALALAGNIVSGRAPVKQGAP